MALKVINTSGLEETWESIEQYMMTYHWDARIGLAQLCTLLLAKGIITWDDITYITNTSGDKLASNEDT